MIVLLATVALLFAGGAFAKDYTVQMLNSDAAGAMVFKPAYLHIQPGDSVTFVATDPGHNSQSVYVPKGATTWQGKLGQNIKVTFAKPGVYIYECKVHYMLGMMGVIQVGNRIANKPAVKQAAHKAASRMVINKDRMTRLMQDVQW